MPCLSDINSSNINSVWVDLTGEGQRSEASAQAKETNPTMRALDEL